MRRRRGPGDRLAMLEEAFGAFAMAEYGAVLDAPHTAASYARLVELAGVLGMPSPPPVGELRTAGEAWASRARLYHDTGTCGRDGHWAHQCGR